MWMSQESNLRQARFTLVEGRDECVVPGNRVGNLDFRARKDVVKRGLNGACVWKETPIEIEHSQETSELTDGLGRGTDLKVCNAFWKGLRSQG